MRGRWCGATQKSGRDCKSPCGELLLLQVGSAFAWPDAKTQRRGESPLSRTARWADQSDASLHMHSNMRRASEMQAGMILGKLSHCNLCPAPAEALPCEVTAVGTPLQKLEDTHVCTCTVISRPAGGTQAGMICGA